MNRTEFFRFLGLLAAAITGGTLGGYSESCMNDHTTKSAFIRGYAAASDSALAHERHYPGRAITDILDAQGLRYVVLIDSMQDGRDTSVFLPYQSTATVRVEPMRGFTNR